MQSPNRDATLAQWIAQEQAMRARLAGPGSLSMAEVSALSPAEFFEGIGNGELPSPPIGTLMDFIPIEWSAGLFIFQGTPDARHYNPLGTVHGGWIATLLDSAVACAIHTLLPVGKTYTTLELKVNYVKGLTEQVPLVRAIGEVIHSGGKIGTSHGRLVAADGTLFAHATTTCIVLDARA